MSNKRSNSFRQAILQGNRRLCSKALLEEKGLNFSQRLIRHVAYETLPREIDRKWYYDSYTCCPPPWFMITVTLLEARTSVGSGGWVKRMSEIVRGEGSVFITTKRQWLKSKYQLSLQFRPQYRACSVAITPGPQRYSKDYYFKQYSLQQNLHMTTPTKTAATETV
uniref:rhomboid protease n=1 Tax=Rousettus aegyptiacus TaxID=9407 RepID=A0A7J8GEM4_ROUAE|nr:rhomboid like 3 [Rousettus aegyptiacus]